MQKELGHFGGFNKPGNTTSGFIRGLQQRRNLYESIIVRLFCSRMVWLLFMLPLFVNAQNLPAPTLSAPANGSTGQSTTPTFTWSSVANATSYRILVATIAADLPTDVTATSAGPSQQINATPTTASYTPSSALSAGTTYYWEVHGRAHNLVPGPPFIILRLRRFRQAVL